MVLLAVIIIRLIVLVTVIVLVTLTSTLAGRVRSIPRVDNFLGEPVVRISVVCSVSPLPLLS